MSTLIEAIQARKSIRSFASKLVPRETIERIIDAATYAPTTCNQQLWHFITVDDQSLKERIVNEAAGSTALARAPAVIFVTYDGWNYKEALQGASLAVGHMLLAAPEYGVVASPLNSYGSDSAIKRILGIPKTEVICCAVTLGFPDERALGAPPVPRRPVGEVLHFNTFTKKRGLPYAYNPDRWTLENLRHYQRYYCRKTFLGKEMDIMSSFERNLVKRALGSAESPLLDVFSYDGAYLREFPDKPIIALDLTKETSEYTEAAVALNVPHDSHRVTYAVYDENAQMITDASFRTAVFNYKFERLPTALATRTLQQIHAALPTDGALIIIARKSNLLLWFFFRVIKMFFGNDMRRTGIYNFFGPYRPLRLSKTLRVLRTAGFPDIHWSGYFPLPPFYEQIYQMFRQYLKSEGSSYLHRTPFRDPMSRILGWCMKVQGFMRVGRLGSVVVIVCKK